jgi:SMI1/KNR4 family protein SUKH-1
MDAREDTLIERLRERAGDATRRTDEVPDRFTDRVRGMTLGELGLNVESIAGDLGRLVSSIQSGSPIDPDLHRKAEAVSADMSAPAERALPAPARPETLDGVEAQVGVPLPDLLRRLYLEVADGGFGPGEGLIAAADMASAYLELRAGSPSEVEDDEWPAGLLPLVAVEAGHACVDASSGRMYESDFEEIEQDDDASYGLVIRDLSMSLEEWLERWLESAPPVPPGAPLQSSMVEMARQSRARIAAMTPEQRAAMGLPETGWEQAVWGGLGLEPDQPDDAA